MRVTAEWVERIAEVAADDWDALDSTGHPFSRHAFLALLEATGCVGGDTGWLPRHLVLRDEAGRLIGAIPSYEKQHSWGEFVFDWHWAQAYARLGLDYYPKLLAAVPFTPVTGPRLLLRDDVPATARGALARIVLEAANERGYPSVHVNFTTASDQEALEAAGFLRREDCRFLWRNASYRDFEHFLERFRADKRKKVRRERRRVAEAGITIETLPGETVGHSLWAEIFSFSERTFLRHGNAHYLSADFLERIAAAMPGGVLIKLARRGPQPIAAAIFVRGADTLFGRYWGSAGHVDCLHFELCYYQGIDYCIEHGLAVFDPGTQGEHKLARGFEPTLTTSAHWLTDPRLRRAIERYLGDEREAVARYRDAAAAHLPFHRSDAA
jgi:predicted N-acyltransferase